MAHLYRFFGKKHSDRDWQLDDDEVTHALKVLRLSDGADVEVMDGNGLVGLGRLSVTSKSKATVVDVEDRFYPQDGVVRSILIGALKPGDIDDLIAPLVELGVDRIVVFRQDDTPQFRVTDHSTDRWQRLVRAAVKQSKRPWNVSVVAFDSLDMALAEADKYCQKWLLAPEAELDMVGAVQSFKHINGTVAALIGGEKGLSPREQALSLNSGFQPVRLGPWILRAKTAATAAAAFLGMLPRQP